MRPAETVNDRVSHTTGFLGWREEDAVLVGRRELLEQETWATNCCHFTTMKLRATIVGASEWQG